MKYSPELARSYSEKRETMSQSDKPFVDALGDLGMKHKAVVDLGSGDGRHARIMKEMGAENVIGIDISEEMITLARNKTTNENVHFVVANGENLPLSNESADIVTSMYVIMYFKDTKKVFGEVARVLKSGGHFVGIFNITDIEPGFEHLENTPMPVRLGKESESIVVHNLIKTPQEIQSSISESGLTILRKEEVSDPLSVVDDSFPDVSHVQKRATLFVLEKKSTADR
ncbi:MAG: class I SAM-dependent methyltransferase [Candidatus Kaiserbacteria bacterium]|nr:class I SAM-dependent methyltransferase [Candidatus Kaiserbacteria bacterium]